MQATLAPHEVMLLVQKAPVEDQHISLDAPRDPLAYEYYLRGVDLYARNDFPMAVEMFRKSVSIDANYAQAWAHLGTAYTAVAAFRFGGQEDYQKALVAYRKALELNPNQIEARIFMANMFTDTSWILRSTLRSAALSYAISAKRSEGFELLEATEMKMKERGVTDAEAMYKIAQTYALLGDKPAALRTLSQSIKGGFFCYPYIKEDPLLNNIRDQREYAVLLETARKDHEEVRSRFLTS